MSRFRAGVRFPPQHTSVAELRRAWRAADELGPDSIWLRDHFVPMYGAPDGAHFEFWSLLAAMAVENRAGAHRRARDGQPLRNPDLLSEMARNASTTRRDPARTAGGAGGDQLSDAREPAAADPDGSERSSCRRCSDEYAARTYGGGGA